MTVNYKHLAEEVGQIARAAGAEIMRIYESEDFGIEVKGDDSPLTKADRAANAVIVAGLEKLTFQAPIISEENAEVAYETRKTYQQFWLVDPLDGTKEFIKRNGEFTVNIALIEDGRPLLGVVYTPVTQELALGIVGQGAWLAGEADEPISVAQFNMDDRGLKVVASRSHLNEATQAYLSSLNEPEVVSKGSSLKILEIAKGDAHIYPRLGPTMEWDTGAAHAVLEAAGGQLVNEETGQPLQYNKSSLLNPYFIAKGKVDA
ncbi:MAG: 3'(2'),5'-bisphosphate nucleotidase CysQ [Bacteroidota bacterium]